MIQRSWPGRRLAATPARLSMTRAPAMTAVPAARSGAATPIRSGVTIAIPGVAADASHIRAATTSQTASGGTFRSTRVT
jgi:hypothetical protein